MKLLYLNLTYHHHAAMDKKTRQTFTSLISSDPSIDKERLIITSERRFVPVIIVGSIWAFFLPMP